MGPRRRLREALLRIGGDLHAPEEHIGAEVRAALCELAAKTLGGRSCAGLVTVGGADDRAGRSLGLRLADYDVGLPEVLLRADESDLPPQVRESCPALVQEEWEAVLLLSKLVLLGLESEAGRRADEARPHLWDAAGPARSVAAGRLCRALTAVAEHPGLHQDELTAQLRAALLDFGSRTPDNLDAVRHLAVLRGGQPGRRARLVLGRSGHACGLCVCVLYFVQLRARLTLERGRGRRWLSPPAPGPGGAGAGPTRRSATRSACSCARGLPGLRSAPAPRARSPRSRARRPA